MMLTYKNRVTRKVMVKPTALLLAIFVSSSVVTLPLRGEFPATPVATPAKTARPSHYQPNPFSRRAESHYEMVWGVSELKVRSAESNEMIRFSYRVLDPAKAKTLNDEKNAPSLIDPKAGVQLVIPSLEKVGKLRQVSAPEAGKVYWMSFSNKGRLVKPGDRINIVIGNFHASGLVVE